MKHNTFALPYTQIRAARSLLVSLGVGVFTSGLLASTEADKPLPALPPNDMGAATPSESSASGRQRAPEVRISRSVDVRLLVTCPTNVFSVGDSVVLRIAVTNAGTQIWNYARGKNHIWETIDVRFSPPRTSTRGRRQLALAPATLYGDVALAPPLGGAMLSTDLRPGHVNEANLSLARFFDLTLAGKYVVEVHTTLFTDGMQTRLQLSNSIPITLLEPAGSFGIPRLGGW